MPRRLTANEREEVLAQSHVAVLSVAIADGPPLTVPVWYEFVQDEIRFITSADSRKARLLLEAGHASICIHNDSRPYWYLTASGSVTLHERDVDDIFAIASRYLPSRAEAERYAQNVDHVGYLVKMVPEKWLSTTYA